MKILRTAAALAFLLACISPALAQQTAIHSVPIGKGAGNTGFNAAVPGTAGEPLISNGPSADPGFGSIANSGLTPGAANTVKGSFDGTSVADIPLPGCTAVNQALKYTSGTGFNCSAVSTTGGYDMPINLGLSAVASGNALTITLTQANGSAPSSGSPVIIPFRSTVATTGTVTFASVSATQSITIPNGATLGTSNGVPFRVWIFEDYNGGTPELGVATCSNVTTIFPCATWEHTLPTSQTIGGSSNTGGVLYATTGVAADAVRIIGFCSFGSGLSTAGAWSSSCTSLQVFGPGVAKPGEVVQTASFVNVSSATTCTTPAFISTTVTGPITPTSAVNLIMISAVASNTSITTNDQVSLTLARGGTGIGQVTTLGVNTPAVPFNVLDAPGSVSTQTYAIYCKGITGNGSVTGGTELMQEIMG
jgi:hypothetical protein